ncbi:hypothetical protein ESOMN_v1c04620 [Williamsoniiplasma somnilux]|uniref:Uncharacterized protein n=1 Tax=Williamsoniiplasma somnilux TaxID=215578 RepID=A0A2K8NYM7_9MOLU|nr:ECF transporter S component [Williamsoniiplasma somnilux]ATZ18844.1 hypothetical protein ESOMN_v1c04620 [Williamsoniiplasma somnilux]
MEQNYRIWSHKYDLSEINKKNYKHVLKEYFALKTSRITILAMLLALNVIFTLISKFLLGMLPIAGFLVVEITFFTILLTQLITNFFYSLIFLELTVWMRMMFTGTTPVELIAMNLVDGFFLIVFTLLIFLTKLFLVQKQLFKESKNFKIIVLIYVIASVIVVLLTAAFAVWMNDAFLLDMYGVDDSFKTSTMYWTIFGFNILKYSVNVIIFLMLYKVTIILINRYRF